MSIVKVNEIAKSFRQAELEIAVLQGLSFSVEPGETLAIVGQSGSGKSTLLSLLAGLDQVDKGEILINDQNMAKLNQAELSHFRGKNIGIIFQQFHLMKGLTALENVMLPLDIQGVKNAETKAKDALALVGLGKRAHHLPEQLSGGEMQRVAIARACVVEPRILLADEPSGNLDTATGGKVMQQLFDAVSERGMTMILVTHDNELAKRCHRQLTLTGRLA
ncbi:MAG: ABC transporter ATP-binding protein [Proteobacteria bacterium]|nr:MAG: ABC transporter ATP-binding protein [Pseudomonadota bacterium]